MSSCDDDFDDIDSDDADFDDSDDVDSDNADFDDVDSKNLKSMNAIEIHFWEQIDEILFWESFWSTRY